MNATNSPRTQPEPSTQFVQTRVMDLELLGSVGSGGVRQFLQQHHHRVGELSRVVALALGLEHSHSEAIAQAGALHDIGKLFVPEAILQQPRPLTDPERILVQKHSLWGSVILGRNPDPIMQLAAKVALQHHESWDGTGYPFGLSREEICVEARIVTVCDVYDALRARRPYKGDHSHEGAMEVIINGDDRIAPAMFDADIVRAFLTVHDKCGDLFNTLRPIG